MFTIVSSKLNFDFIGKRVMFASVSIVLILLSFVLLGTKGLIFGIDFTGGAVIQVKFNEATETAQVRGWLDDQNVRISSLQRIGADEENEFQIKLQGEAKELSSLSDNVSAAFGATVGDGKFTIRKVDVVGPAAGAELRTKSYWAAFYALLCILIYIAIRFDFRYSPGAIVALVHDTILTLGFFVIIEHEFTLQIVAALLTIIGYSINDTIVVYDRIRETIAANPKNSLEENINISINSTLGRTVVTSLTTMLAISALWLFGGGIIEDFAIALFVGVLVGTYSSIFVASPAFLFMAKYARNKEIRKKQATAS